MYIFGTIALVCFAGTLAAPRSKPIPTTPSPVQNCSSTEAFYEPTQKCYTVSTLEKHERGPCPEKKFFAKRDDTDTVGRCFCGRPDQKCSRPLVPYLDDDSCQVAFTQGPCPDGQWLVHGKDKPLVCEKNVCIGAPLPGVASLVEARYQGEVFFFARNGQCHVTETQAFCPEGMVARFEYDNWYPNCYKPEEHTCGAF